ncbi:MAG: hypothetical protein HC908_03390 [Calothrix sp. SM1_7_51]|nr:hypothetical protein [Calothrix sp. SM1_7_51]
MVATFRVKVIANDKYFLTLEEKFTNNGLRLVANASPSDKLVSTIRPGLAESCGTPLALVTVVFVVAPPPGVSTKLTRAGLYKKPTRIFPPG